MSTYHGDLRDAQTWITKALLLGAEITEHESRINTVQWRYSVRRADLRVPPIITDDWPGRACKKFVEQLQEEQKHVVR